MIAGAAMGMILRRQAPDELTALGPLNLAAITVVFKSCDHLPWVSCGFRRQRSLV